MEFVKLKIFLCKESVLCLSKSIASHHALIIT